MASATLITPVGASPSADDSDRGREGRCKCGQVLRVLGGGRHRVYFKPGNLRLDDPVMNRVCPECGRGLPGKNGRADSGAWTN